MRRIGTVARHFGSTPKVRVEYAHGNCRITLNNDKALNALDLEMVRGIRTEIDKWAAEKRFPDLLILTANPDAKAFCAGGDIKSLYKRREEGAPMHELDHFFKEEYELDYLLSQLPRFGTVTCAFWNGIVMGGGVGLSIHSTFRVATPKTVFAMPEALIGLFPDVGAMHPLARLPPSLAFALAIGGLKLTGVETQEAGVATHFVQETEVQKAIQDLFDNFRPHKEEPKADLVRQLLSKHSYRTPETAKVSEQFAVKLESIKKTFSGKTLAENVEAVGRLDPGVFQDLQRNFSLNSPLSMAVTWEYLHRARTMPLRDVYLADYNVVRNCLRHTEFWGGIKNLIIDKSKGRAPWQHGSLAEVSAESVRGMFESPKDSGESPRIDLLK